MTSAVAASSKASLNCVDRRSCICDEPNCGARGSHRLPKRPTFAALSSWTSSAGLLSDSALVSTCRREHCPALEGPAKRRPPPAETSRRNTRTETETAPVRMCTACPRADVAKPQHVTPPPLCAPPCSAGASMY